MRIKNEPKGLGAVVRDRDGFLWLSNRFESSIEWSKPWWCCDLSEYADWADISAVDVLTEGVVINQNSVSS